MWLRLNNLWEKLRTSYWFIPSLMAVGSLLLGFAVTWMDAAWTWDWLWESGWAHKNEPEGARALLSTVAGGTITVAGVVFSITIVALSLASQQFGPRLLYNFMRDRSNQFVFGVFIGAYLYCLLVLRTIRQGDELFVPHLSVLVGFLLAVLSLGVLIYFIHHVAESIQAMTVIAAVHEDLQYKIDSLFPESYESAHSRQWLETQERWPEDLQQGARAIRAEKTGYLQAIDEEKLLRIGEECDLLIELRHRPGHYVIAGTQIARVCRYQGAKEAETWDGEVVACFIVGRQRTQEQDVEFLIHELVEIAVRALSPGINDPHTAITCIDRLGSSLAELSGRAMPRRHRRGAQGRLRLVARAHSWDGLVDASLDQIRQYGVSSVAVSIRLLEMIAEVLPFTRDDAQAEVLLRQAAMIERGSRKVVAEPEDRDDIHRKYLELFEILTQERGLAAGR